ncbi:hypothetical protein C8R44DRAFT_776861 [Mycena epipterygia]|nr:hypothetical protein C8R44DRAFT_776861 [Mycena epipterygia]
MPRLCSFAWLLAQACGTILKYISCVNGLVSSGSLTVPQTHCRVWDKKSRLTSLNSNCLRRHSRRAGRDPF